MGHRVGAPGGRPAALDGRRPPPQGPGRLRRLGARPHHRPVLRLPPARVRQRARRGRAGLGVRARRRAAGGEADLPHRADAARHHHAGRAGRRRRRLPHGAAGAAAARLRAGAAPARRRRGQPLADRGPRAAHQSAGHAGHAIGVHHCGIRRNHAARLSHEQSRQAGLSAPLERCRPLSRHHRSGPPGRSHGGEAAHPRARGVAAGDLAVGQGADADAPRRHVRADAPAAALPARRARAQARGPRGGRPAGRAAQPVGARRGRRRRLRAGRSRGRRSGGGPCGCPRGCSAGP